ncbi:unnamed protein product [Didymodactylos carnosus]|uniref:SRPBCC domain-containing protein n=1 Tax=Didymodactylos carnosus TaxID=1234261 RepID=A0A8S2QM90_9BILA|nr:unnamed protein product [Didymodactylos carnosus]CAF4121401.1 unnamed protein product [Didymodactylos carnosus]
MSSVIAETRITIGASIEKVWEIILDTANYHKWNPFVIRVETEDDVTQEGAKMKLYVKWANGKEDSSDEIVTDTKPPHVDSAGYKRAHWSYRFDGYLHYFGLVRATRYQWLEQQSDGTTNYHTRE